MLKFVCFSKTGVVLLILQQKCCYVSLRAAEHDAILFKPRADTLVMFWSHVHRIVTVFTYSFVMKRLRNVIVLWAVSFPDIVISFPGWKANTENETRSLK